MESVLNKPYYGYCGSLLYAAGHSPALNETHGALLRPHALPDIYNLRPRNTAVMSKQEAGQSGVAMIAGPKRERAKPINRSRTAYNKRLQVNARERERMKTLNKGFENLRNALPCYIADGHISKITTLRLAINYIRTLTDVLKDENNDELPNEGTPTQKMAIMHKLNSEALLLGNGNRPQMQYAPPFSAPLNPPGNTKPHTTFPTNYEPSTTINFTEPFSAVETSTNERFT